MSDGVTRFVRSAVGPDPGGPPDLDLLRRFALTRDAGAFELLVWRHAGMVRAAALAVARDRHLAEDAAQAAFLLLARKADRVRENPAGWLYRVARRVAVRQRRRADRAAPVGWLADVPDAGPGGSHPPLASADAAAVHAELARLPDRERLPVLLCLVEGLSHADAAARLGWPVGTVAGRLSRGRTRLRDRLVRRGLAPVLAGLTVGGDGRFAAATTRAAVAFVAGDPAAVSPTVLTLVFGANRAMWYAKLKLAAGLVAACGVITAGGVWAGGQQPAGGEGGAPAGPVGAPPGLVPAAAAPPPRVERLKVDPKAPNPGKPEDPKRAADYAARQRSLKNLKQILVAWHSHFFAHNRLAADSVGRDGKPLLSWRVHLLPFLEKEALYKQFKLDEPWHSPANKPLLAKMPAVYRTAFQPTDAIYTYYQGFAGPDTVFEPGQPLGLANITDGSSNTVAIAEVGPPVAWTEPADVPYDPAQRFPVVAWPYTNVINLGFADGAVRRTGHALSEHLLRNLIERQDGYLVPDIRDLAPDFPEELAERRKEAELVLAENQALLDRTARLLKEYGDLLRAEPLAGNPDRQGDARHHLRQLADQLAERVARLKGQPPAKK